MVPLSNAQPQGQNAEWVTAVISDGLQDGLAVFSANGTEHAQTHNIAKVHRTIKKEL
jgi:hypothetical protein